MRKKIYLACTVLSIMMASAFAKYAHGGEMNNTAFIKEFSGIDEYRLKNGMKVVIKEDKSIPLVTFSIWYKVGSRNETDGIRGIAHFLEHMMFKGTKKYKKGEISNTIQEHGGVFNAFTFYDGTAYYETIAPEYLEKMLELESDRMQNSLLDKDELNSEKTVVISELKGGLNNPSRLLDMEVRKAAFESSPYMHPVIGYEPEIKEINSQKMKEFYKKYYNPQNSTIVIVGDIKKEKALELVEKYFSDIPIYIGEEEINIPKEAINKGEKRVEVKQRGTTKLVEVAFNTPSIKEKDILALNVLEEILIAGRKSSLNEALVEKELATEVYGGTESYTDPCLFYILCSLTPEAEHKRIEEIILSEINNLIKTPPSEKEIEGAKSRIKANYLFGLDGSYNQAVQIGYFEVITGDWEKALTWTSDIEKVTKEDVKRVLNTYFKKENRTIGYFIPELLPGEEYSSVPIEVGGTQHYKDPKTVKEKGMVISSKDYFNNKRVLRDGSEIIVVNDIDIPITYITGQIIGGSSLVNKESEVTCDFLDTILEKGSKRYSKDKLENILDETGSNIGYSCAEDHFRFSSVSLNEHAEKTIDILLDGLMNPKFSEKEIEKEKNLAIAELLELSNDSGAVARRGYSQLIYDKNHPLFNFTFEEEKELTNKINKEPLIEVHDKVIRKNKAQIILTTSLNGKELDKLIDHIESKLNTNSVKESAKPIFPNISVNEVAKEKITTLSDKHQSDIFIGHITNVKRNHPDFYALHIANQIIGGDPLTSKLAKTIRDKHGLVYTVISFITPSFSQGEFGIYCGATGDKVDKTIALVKEELTKIKKAGVTKEEVEKAKKYLIDSYSSKHLSNNKKIAVTLSTILLYDLGDNYLKEYANKINEISVDDVNKVIRENIHPEKLNVSICGDYKKS